MMTQKKVNIDNIRIPRKHRRGGRPDRALYDSVRNGGVKFPILVVQGEGEYILADGGERIRILKSLGKKMVEAVVHTTTESDRLSFARLIRVISNHHRKGFYPSQRAHYMRIHMRKYNITPEQMAKALGRNVKTINSWLSVADCSEEIQMLINNGRWPIRAGLWLSSLSSEGQAELLAELRDRERVSVEELRTRIRGIQEEEPETVRKPTVSVARRPYKKRRTTVRADYIKNMSLPDILGKIEEVKKETEFMRREIIAARKPIESILSNKKLVRKIPNDALQKFRLFIQG